MNDLHLWRWLRGANDDDPTDALRELARRPLGDRSPWIGNLERALASDDPAIRRLALRIHGGAAGLPTVRALHAALDDPDATVRIAALTSLQHRAESAPGWWSLALFHPRPDVREAAVRSTPPRARSLLFYLLPDPEVGPIARESAEVPPDGLLPLLAMHASGVVDLSLTRRWLAALDLQLAAIGPARSTGELTASAGWGATPAGRDGLDRVLRVLVDPEPDGAARDRVLAHLVDAAWSSAASRDRLAVAMRAAAPDPPVDWLATIVALCPSLLVDRGCPAARRRAALAHLGATPRRKPALALGADEASDLLGGPLVREADGRFDTPALVAGLEHAPSARTWIPELLLDPDFGPAAARDPVAFARLLSLPLPTRVHLELLGVSSDAAGAVAAAFLATCRVTALMPPEPDRPPTLPWQLPDPLVVAAVAELCCRPRGWSDARSQALAQFFAHRLDATAAPSLVAGWEAGELAPVFGARVLEACLRAWGGEAFLEAVADLAADALCRVLWRLEEEAALPGGVAIVLVRLLAESPHADLGAWAEAHRPRSPGAPPPPPALRRLTPSEQLAIRDASPADLGGAVEPALRGPVRGLVSPLTRRSAPATPNADVALALLGCHDDPADVCTELARFAPGDAPLAVQHWLHNPSLPLIGNAVVHRWEKHALQAVAQADRWTGGVQTALERSIRWAWAPATEELWRAVARGLAVLRYRDRDRFAVLAGSMDPGPLVAALPQPWGDAAADLLRVIRAAKPSDEVARIHAAIEEVLPDLAPDIRRKLFFVGAAVGLATAVPPAGLENKPSAPHTIAAIRASTDLDHLEDIARGAGRQLVQEAVLRLIDLGEPALRRLVAVLRTTPRVPGLRFITESLPLWDAGPALQEALALDDDRHVPPETRFAVGLARLELDVPRPEPLLQAVTADDEPGWFRPADLARLDEALGAMVVARAIATSVHPRAYRPAVKRLLAIAQDDEAVWPLLTRFLELGDDRDAKLRRAVASRLLERGDRRGVVLLLQRALTDPGIAVLPLHDDHPEDTRALVRAALAHGTPKRGEGVLRQLVARSGLPPSHRAETWRFWLLNGLDASARAWVTSAMERGAHAATATTRVARVFAWGVLRGLELTGRRITIKLTRREAALGHTPLDKAELSISAVPMLRGERHGQQIVEGLILHELGHQRYHRSDAMREAWQTAVDEGLHPVLNLVLDEHLERNLRALDAGFGDRLKRLAAYAFQHMDRDLAIGPLCARLGPNAAAALIAAPLAASRDPRSVRVGSGALLHALEGSGSSFGRFVRALRMGLGNRWGDPHVAAALAKFKNRFRKWSAAELLDLARWLADHFGHEILLAGSLGGHETLDEDAGERGLLEGAIDDGALEDEVERILHPEKRDPDDHRPGGPSKAAINVADDATFDRITQVILLDYDRAAAEELAAPIRRAGHRLRSWLHDLGLAYEPRRFRLSGTRFDRTRARAVVLRGDPRMLIARERHTRADLFVGVVIDCSGSMSAGRSMVLAKRFGALVAEATRGLGGVDARFFGFTHSRLYDAGSADRCAVHALEAAGGNNDAAALFHVAQVARRSQRTARLLVMISDGLPTECSVQALRGLVRSLGREGFCVAQIAVRPLAEVCFPHFVDVSDKELGPAVDAFGATVARLVRRALGG